MNQELAIKLRNIGLALLLLAGAMTSGFGLGATPAKAALVEVVVQGSTDNSEGDIAYAPGGTFEARIVVDASYPDFNTNSAEAGNFFDFVTSALVSFEVVTPLGTVVYLPATVTSAFLGPQVGQIQGPNTQTVNIVSANSTVPGDGFSGTITGLGVPNAIGLSLASLGPNDNFFTDPNVLFSGAGSLSKEAEILGGVISISSATTGNDTALGFGAAEFVIRPVPLPSALWLLGGALVSLRRRRR